MPSFPDQRWRVEFGTATAEIVANILRHAYPAGVAAGDRTAKLTLALHRDRVEAVSTDHGDAIAGDLDRLTPGPEAGQLVEGGWGLAIARALLDELSYERRPDGTNRWHLTKRFPT